ncbi:MAG: hypothetical protein JWO89_1958, partial [Verrucomicrobiaceae bacterium]|nr:hypothetical protein [Verrucomicrobiaceae bacterium]
MRRLGVIGRGHEQPEGQAASEHRAGNDPGILQQLLRLQTGRFRLHGMIEIEQHCRDDEGEDKHQVVQLWISGHGDASAEAEQVGVGDHRQHQGLLGVCLERTAVAAAEFGVIDEAEFGVALARH